MLKDTKSQRRVSKYRTTQLIVVTVVLRGSSSSSSKVVTVVQHLSELLVLPLFERYKDTPSLEG